MEEYREMDDTRPIKRQRLEEEKEGADDNRDGAKPAPSKWRLRGDACVGLGEQPAENMSAAGRWMFEDARDRGELTDMQFLLDSGRKIRGHKLWLMARCEYIRCMLSSGMQEGKSSVVRVRECSEGVFIVILEFLYTGELGHACLGQDWRELWGIADLFGCEEMCRRLLHAVTVGNVEEAAHLAVETGMRPLMERCVKVLHSKTAGGDEARSFIRTTSLLCGCGDDYIWRLVGEWLISDIKFVIRTYIYDEFVCGGGFLVLRQYAESSAWHDDSISVDVAVKEELNAVVIRGLKKHREIGAIQEHGFAFLRKCAEGRKKLFFDSNAGYWRTHIDCIFMDSGGVDAAVQALKAHKTNAQVQAQVLRTLHASTEDTGVYDDVLDLGGLEAIVEVLGIHTENIDVQVCGCGMIDEICRENTCKSRAGDAGAVEAIVEALKAHHSNHFIACEASSALLTLCTDNDKEPGDDSSFDLLHRGRAGAAVEVIVRAIDQDAFDPRSTQSFFDLLSCLCEDVSSNAHRAVEAGAMKSCVAAFEREFDDGGYVTVHDLRESACSAMLSILVSDAENLCSAVLDAGGLNAIVKLLQRYTTEFDDEVCWDYYGLYDGTYEILDCCCRILSTICDENCHEKCRRLALSLGAMPALHRAVRQHPDNEVVQGHGRMALKRLGEYASPSVLGHFRPAASRGPYFGNVTLRNVERAASVAVKNGMRPLMERCVSVLPLRLTPTDMPGADIGSISHSVSLILSLFCESGDSKSRQIVRPRLSTVVEAMRLCHLDIPLQERGLFVLRHATSCGDFQLHFVINRDMFRERYWDETVVSALVRYPESAAVQEHGFATLSNCMEDVDYGLDLLTTDSSKKKRCYIPDHVVHIMRIAAKVLKTHKANAQVQEQVCRALVVYTCRSQFEKFSQFVFHGGGLGAIVEALRTHRDNIGVQEYGCTAIGIICCHCPAASSNVTMDSALEAIVEVLRLHLKCNRRILLIACNEVFRLCSPLSELQHEICLENRGRAGEAGCVEAIMTAIETHPKNGQVLQTCFELLACLCGDNSGDYYNASRALRAGAIRAMSRTLRDLDVIRFEWDGEEDDLVDSVCEAFRGIFVQGESGLVRAVLDAGGIEVIVHLLKHYSKDGDEGCWPCDDDECSSREWSGRTSSKIMRMRMKMSRTSSVSTTNLSVDASWSSDTEQVEGDGSCSEELEECCKMLNTHLDEIRRHDCRLALSLGAMPALHRAVRQLPDNEVVQEHGRMALKRLGEYASPSVLGHFRPAASRGPRASSV